MITEEAVPQKDYLKRRNVLCCLFGRIVESLYLLLAQEEKFAIPICHDELIQ